MIRLITLTDVQRKILLLCCGDNLTGRCGWPLQSWEGAGGVREHCEPLFKARLLKERRLGGYPGIEITSKGRQVLAADKIQRRAA